MAMTAKEHMEDPDACPFCDADQMDVDVDNDGDGHCCKCQRSWKVERRYIGYSYVDEEGDRHEIVEEPRDRIATLQEQVRILREATEVLIDWMGEAEIELGGPLNVGYKARMQKPVAVEKVRAALEATKEEA